MKIRILKSMRWCLNAGTGPIVELTKGEEIDGGMSRSCKLELVEAGVGEIVQEKDATSDQQETAGDEPKKRGRKPAASK